MDGRLICDGRRTLEVTYRPAAREAVAAYCATELLEGELAPTRTIICEASTVMMCSAAYGCVWI